MMNFKGYDAKIEFDDESGVFDGHVINIRDTIHFQGTDADSLRKAFHDSIDDYLEWCENDGREPAKPYKGNYPLRMSPDMHRAIAIEADKRGVSINEYLVETIGSTLE